MSDPLASTSTAASTRVNSPIAQEADFEDCEGSEHGSEYYDATRVNSVDLEIATKQLNQHDGRPERTEEKEAQESLLELNEVENPVRWSKKRRWASTLLVGSIYLNSTLCSSIATGATEEYMNRFGASAEVSSLVLSCYLIGFAFGPLFWSPFSEVYGRNLSLKISIPCFLLFNIGCAVSNNMATLLTLRVFAGLFGACPQSVSGAIITDMWPPAERLWPMFAYTSAAFMGPALGPSIGGFLYVSGNWTFIYYLLAILAGVNLTLVFLIHKETYAPVLHKWKAFRLRKEGRPNLYAPMETQDTGVLDLLRVHVSRPLVMLTTELPVAYAALWTGFAYAVLFIFFEAYPVVFQGIYGMNAGEEGLCFLGLGVGIISSTPIVWYSNKRSLQAAKSSGGKPVPEARLQQVMFSAPLFVIGFFWFGWTSRSDIHWIVPVLSSIPIGISLILSFNALTVYVAQCYPVYSASVLGGMAFSRCFVAIFVPLFGRQMYEGLGPGWAFSVLGFVSLAAIPVPIIFYRYGSRIRDKSRLAISSS
ncbi:hypothetical protein CBS101457_002118 [Exobasidium rhododendri]|nr:hypothetical protein CBS101457_002118 [Exobasidium rhododendri]